MGDLEQSGIESEALRRYIDELLLGRLGPVP
jgi:hypothetical protein